ncbi:MAG: hypothetical protein AMXMBFR58_36130 [Phycisphaerae bacterium]|nr:hypothetical protein [Phycisphaerales bacterium]MCK6477399.1 hypothetical protein [Phycisphaerales bacterium]
MSQESLSRVAIATVCGAALAAHADIIHTDIDDAVLIGALEAEPDDLLVDFNQDGADEILLSAYYVIGSPGTGGPKATAGGLDHASILVGTSPFVAHAATYGELIGPTNPEYYYAPDANIDKEWLSLPPEQGAYLGVRFALNENNHYGWVRLSARIDEPSDTMVMTVFEFAYETVEETPIPAGAVPSPGSMAALAVGVLAGCRGAGRRR